LRYLGNTETVADASIKNTSRESVMTGSISLCHWGAFVADVEHGRLVAARPWAAGGADPDMIGALPEWVYSKQRVMQPHVRESWLADQSGSNGTGSNGTGSNGAGSNGSGRGVDRMVPVDWDTALELVANELRRVRDSHGHDSIFAGSYGWSSAGRLHHARSQLRRFFGAFGGFTDQVGNYSWGAAAVILPHVLGDHSAVSAAATSWKSISGNTDLFIAFGGLNPKNWRVTSGGAGFHHMRQHVQDAYDRGTQFVVISPVSDDIPCGIDATWIAPRPGTDTAIMLGMCHELLQRGRADKDFLARYCVGSDALLAYLDGEDDNTVKSLAWAAQIADVPLAMLSELAERCMTGRVMLSASWSLQRAHHGEQTYWTLIALAAMLGQIGLPGGGFTFGYGSLNGVGEHARKGLVPHLPLLGNQAGASIPVARVADMLEHPGKTLRFNGTEITFPDTRLIYWAGGNPFHHAQDLFRLQRLWSTVDTVIVHEQFWTATARRADIVLPATTSLERNDIGGSSRDPHVFYMPALIKPLGESRNDVDIFRQLATLLGFDDQFSVGRNETDWLRWLWRQSEREARRQGLDAPDFDSLVSMNVWQVPVPDRPEVLLEDFRNDPVANPLPTPSGRIEIGSQAIASFGYADVPGHPVWRAPSEWLGNAARDELALLSRQPEKFLHSQLAQTSLAGSGPPQVLVHPMDAHDRDLQDQCEVRVVSRRGACLALLRTSHVCRRGIAVMQTGPWFVGASDGFDAGGNPNSLTPDLATSALSQAPAAQTCLVRLIRADSVD